VFFAETGGGHEAEAETRREGGGLAASRNAAAGDSECGRRFDYE
jgi:hypothetical protein